MQSIDQEGKTVDEALEKALMILSRTKEEIDYEVLDEGSKGILGVGARPILVRVRVKELPEMQKVKDVLNSFFSDLDINHQPLELDVKNNVIKIDIDTEEAGILIGKYGQVLESIQYIVNQIMHESKYKYMVDISNYREKQNAKLVETAKRFAGIVRDEQRKIILKPMSAFERRIVHETIKEFPELVTKSIGVDPERRVVISLLNPPARTENDGYGRRDNKYSQGGGNKPYRKPNSNYQRSGSGGGGYRPGGNSEGGNSYGSPEAGNRAGNTEGGNRYGNYGGGYRQGGNSDSGNRYGNSEGSGNRYGNSGGGNRYGNSGGGYRQGGNSDSGNRYGNPEGSGNRYGNSGGGNRYGNSESSGNNYGNSDGSRKSYYKKNNNAGVDNI